MVVLGLTGILGMSVWPAGAAQPSGRVGSDGHDTMHEMMDAAHGPGTSARMHDVEGAEEMMAQCASMMEMMSHGGMMDGGMMGRGR